MTSGGCGAEKRRALQSSWLSAPMYRALVEPRYCLIPVNPVTLEVSQYRTRGRVDSEYGVYCTPRNDRPVAGVCCNHMKISCRKLDLLGPNLAKKYCMIVPCQVRNPPPVCYTRGVLLARTMDWAIVHGIHRAPARTHRVRASWHFPARVTTLGGPGRQNSTTLFSIFCLTFRCLSN